MPAATSVNAGAPNPTSVNLTWQNNWTSLPSEASLYAGWWQYGYSSQWTWIPLSSTSQTSTAQSVNAGTHYAWEIATCTPAVGCSDSALVDVTTPMPAPSPYISAATSNSITTSWANPASTTTSYSIARSYNYGAYGAWTPIGNVTSYTDTGLYPGTWSYVVSACSPSVCSGPSFAASWTISSGGAAPARGTTSTGVSGSTPSTTKPPALPAPPTPQTAATGLQQAPKPTNHPVKPAVSDPLPPPKDPNSVR